MRSLGQEGAQLSADSCKFLWLAKELEIASVVRIGMSQTQDGESPAAGTSGTGATGELISRAEVAALIDAAVSRALDEFRQTQPSSSQGEFKGMLQLVF